MGQGPTKTTLARSLVEYPFDPQLRTIAHSTDPTQSLCQKLLRPHRRRPPPALLTSACVARVIRATTIGLAATNLSSVDIVALQLTLLRCEAHLTGMTVG